MNMHDVTDVRKFTAARVAQVELADAPIPESWILSGTPRARNGALAMSADGWASCVVWECTAGSFRWRFGWEETVVILEGAVRVISETGEVRVLSPGDVAYFGPNTTAEWQIDEYVKKIAFSRAHVPAYVRRPLAAVRNVRARLEALARTLEPAGALRKLFMAALGLSGSWLLLSMVLER